MPLEVSSNTNSRHNHVVTQQINVLKSTINLLKNAYNGNDIERPDIGN